MAIEIEEFIKNFRDTDGYMQLIFSLGSCYKFAIFLQKLYGGEIVVNTDLDHAALKVGMLTYDIEGVNNKDKFHAPSNQELDIMRRWSFCGNHLLSLGECESCGEPVKLV